MHYAAKLSLKELLLKLNSNVQLAIEAKPRLLANVNPTHYLNFQRDHAYKRPRHSISSNSSLSLPSFCR